MTSMTGLATLVILRCIQAVFADQLNYDEEFVYPSKADQFATTEFTVGNIATIQWKSVQPANTIISLWLSHSTSAQNLCPHTSSAQCAKIAGMSGLMYSHEPLN
jgi:hypothetical protein